MASRSPRATAQEVIKSGTTWFNCKPLAEAAEAMAAALTLYNNMCCNPECSTHPTFDGGQQARAALAQYEGRPSFPEGS